MAWHARLDDRGLVGGWVSELFASGWTNLNSRPPLPLPESQPGKADRRLRPGQLYTPPPPGPGIAPESVGDLEAWRRLIENAAETDASLPGRLTRAFRGMSPLLAAAICSGLQEQDTSAADWQRAWDRWRVWVDKAREGSLLPGPDWLWSLAGQDHEHDVKSAAAPQQLLFNVHEAVQQRHTLLTPTAPSAEDRFAKVRRGLLCDTLLLAYARVSSLRVEGVTHRMPAHTHATACRRKRQQQLHSSRLLCGL